MTADHLLFFAAILGMAELIVTTSLRSRIVIPPLGDTLKNASWFLMGVFVTFFFVGMAGMIRIELLLVGTAAFMLLWTAESALRTYGAFRAARAIPRPEPPA